MSGRKRHLAVDARGLILPVLVHPADAPDRRAPEAVSADLRDRYPEVECLFADMDYQGLAPWLSAILGWILPIVKRPDAGCECQRISPPPEMRPGLRLCRGAGSSNASSLGSSATAA